MKHTTCFSAADILLPDFKTVDGTKWSCVACDQYTSQPEYWLEVDKTVGDAPSALRLIIPEAFLSESARRTPAVLAAMQQYVDSVLKIHPNSMVLVERTLANGYIRHGLVGKIDLERYDYGKGARELIRATEETVPERIPARMTVRREAPIELPHAMLLLDYRKKTVIEPLYENRSKPDAYDFSLMQDSGHLRGWFLTPAEQECVLSALDALITPTETEAKYGTSGLSPLLFAVGDGNHSLAAAKACWEEVKATLTPAEAERHPARYALAEAVNLYDESLVFEPIYRTVSGVNPTEFVRELKSYTDTLSGTMTAQSITWTAGQESGQICVSHPSSPLTVGTVQSFLNAYVTAHPDVSVDYIHGTSIAVALAQKPDTVALLFDGMAKEDLFRTVIADGALPRKTFSMGHAQDKRFYTEARKIKEPPIQ